MLSLSALACEQCKCQGANTIDLLAPGLDDAFRSALKSPTPASTPAPNADSRVAPQPSALAETPSSEGCGCDGAARTRWYFDTTFEFVSYSHQSVADASALLSRDRDTHAHIKEFSVTQRFAYAITRDIQISLAQGFRSLYMKEIDDPDHLGLNERSSGATDLDLGMQYRFLHQRPGGSPVDLMVFGDIKARTGTTNNRRPGGDLFETEDQPGTGSWNETLGLSAGKRWGGWAATAAYSYTHKGEGSQRFKEGDINRLALNASHRISPDNWQWRVFYSQGVQGFTENEAHDHGTPSKDHGGAFIYAIPGITVQPNPRLVLTVNANVPIYQEENGFHQKDRFAIQFNVGVRF